MSAQSAEPLDYDAIVIGSGAGGSAAAYTLVRAGWRVALIEKGLELPTDGSTLDVNAVVTQGRFKSHETWLDGSKHPFEPEEHFNIGGKTKWYGAALLRYSTQEFQADAAYECRGWPFGIDELTPRYEEAEKLLGVRSFPCEPALAQIVAKLRDRCPEWRTEPMPLGLAANILTNRREASHFDGFASVAGLKGEAETSFLTHIRSAPNLTLLSGAPVADLLGESGNPRRIRGVRLSDAQTMTARHVLLAAGAMHSPRLLQRYIERNRLQDSIVGYREVGANFKMHMLTAMVAVSPRMNADLIRKTMLFLNDAFPHSSVQPLGFDAELISTLIPRLVPRFIARSVGRRAYGFFLQTEDGSSIDNRVTAGGAGGAEAEYPMMDYSQSRLRPALGEHLGLIANFRAALLRIGLIGFSQHIGISGTAHANGTLITGEDPKTSVVDRDGKVHGFDSLYVVDGSILPRSSRVNPSLTIYAWALRVAGKLARQNSASPRA